MAPALTPAPRRARRLGLCFRRKNPLMRDSYEEIKIYTKFLAIQAEASYA